MLDLAGRDPAPADVRNQPKAWLVAYDIRQPRRLRRAHRLLRKEGVPAQYSAFSVEATDAQIERLLERLRTVVDERADDVRAYHVPAHCTIWSLGVQQWPDGICLSATHASRLLTTLGAATEDNPASTTSALLTSST